MSSLANKLLQHSDDNRKEILAIFGKNEVSVTQDLEAIKKWILKIEYLPSNISKSIRNKTVSSKFYLQNLSFSSFKLIFLPGTKKIEIFLILNKFKIEKTKEKLQLYYKSKNSNSDLIRRTYATDTRMQECIDKVIHVPLPKLVDNKRVIFVDFKPDSAEFFDQVALGAYLLRMLDVLFEEDYALGSIIVWNIKNFNVKHLCKVDVSVLKSMQNVVEKVCSGRIFAVHVVHPPAVFGKIYNIFKTLLKSKYIQRVSFH